MYYFVFVILQSCVYYAHLNRRTSIFFGKHEYLIKKINNFKQPFIFINPIKRLLCVFKYLKHDNFFV